MFALKFVKVLIGASAAAALIAVAAPSGPARAQTALPAGASCVEIVPAQPGAAPAILLDKCSGKTWQLQREWTRRHSVYVWRPLVRQDVEAPVQRPTPVAAAPARAPAASGKCFSFNGRTFCE